MSSPLENPRMLQLFRDLYAAERALWNHHKIRGDGAYAERLVALALGAQVVPNGVNRGFDLLHPELNRIEVRSRRKPFDGRTEERIDLNEKKRGYFDYYAHVVFDCDYTVVGACLIPHDAAYRLLAVSGRRYIQFRDAARLPEAKDITAEVVAAQLKI